MQPLVIANQTARDSLDGKECFLDVHPKHCQHRENVYRAADGGSLSPRAPSSRANQALLQGTHDWLNMVRPGDRRCGLLISQTFASI